LGEIFRVTLKLQQGNERLTTVHSAQIRVKSIQTPILTLNLDHIDSLLILSTLKGPPIGDRFWAPYHLECILA